MVYDILESIVNIEQKPLETINLVIFIEKSEETITSQIIEIAKKVKTLKIITNEINKFMNLEEILYIEYGIAVQITNNKKRAGENADVIINYDMRSKND